MSTVMQILLEITLGSWLTAGMIILIRLLFGKLLSARSKYLLWLLLAVRLCLPVLPYSPWSLYHIPAQAEMAAKQQETLSGSGAENAAYVTPTPIPTGTAEASPQQTYEATFTIGETAQFMRSDTWDLMTYYYGYLHHVNNAMFGVYVMDELFAVS